MKSSKTMVQLFVTICITITTLSVSLTSCSREERQTNRQEHALSGIFNDKLKDNEMLYSRLSDVNASVLIRVGNKIILADPGLILPFDIKYLSEQKIDLILYTKSSGDHFNEKTLQALYESLTPYVVVDESMLETVQGMVSPKHLKVAKHGEKLSIGDFMIDSIPGYDGFPNSLYRVSVNGISFFHGGDSTYVPVQGLEAQIAFISSGGPEIHGCAEDAIQFTRDLNASVVVPIHGYGFHDKAYKERASEKGIDAQIIVSQLYEIHKISL